MMDYSNVSEITIRINPATGTSLRCSPLITLGTASRPSKQHWQIRLTVCEQSKATSGLIHSRFSNNLVFCGMTETAALITAALRYCKEHYAYWANRYANERTGQDFPEYTYSDSDYNLFPRYHALSAILGEIEMQVDQVYASLAVCREALIHIGNEAQSPFTESEDNAIEKAAIRDERDKFVRFIQTITPEALSQVAPLPYRRRLNEKEKEAVKQQLLERWNYDNEYWDPVVEKSPAEVIFLPKAEITTADYQSIIHFLDQHAATHLLEVTEEDIYTAIAQSEIQFNSYETMYCDSRYNWLIYISHESTITFAGDLLLLFIRQHFKEREALFNQWPG